jgi:hypothetical protein
MERLHTFLSLKQALGHSDMRVKIYVFLYTQALFYVFRFTPFFAFRKVASSIPDGVTGIFQ